MSRIDFIELNTWGLTEKAIRENFQAMDYELKVLRGLVPMPVLPSIRIPIHDLRSRQLPMNQQGENQ